MLLAIDAGNTQTVVGLYELDDQHVDAGRQPEHGLLDHWRIATVHERTSDELAVMLLDVLSGLESLQVAVAYEDEHGRRVREFPAHLDDLERFRPVYETLPGWSEDITGARSWGELPPSARLYVRYLAEQVGVPVSIVSVGPDRSATLRVE